MSTGPDPRWEWAEICMVGEVGSTWVRTGCRHTELVPVESVAGEVVARLCLTCDEQMPPPSLEAQNRRIAGREG